MDGRIEIIQEVTPGFKDTGLVLRLCELIVDIIEADGS